MSKLKQEYFPNVWEIARTLVKVYGRPTLGNKRIPFDELLFIVLSSKTPPDRYNLTYRVLKEKYPVADDLAHVKPASIARTIAFGGLAEKKARQISTIAKMVLRKFGRVTLNPLRQTNNQEAEAFLDALPGIGKKTARCILMYSFDRPVFPVDAHCFRISKRLGWIPQNGNLTNRIADELQRGIPPSFRRDLHVGMILLGREYCQAQNPYCSECPLLSLCPTGKQQSKQATL